MQTETRTSLVLDLADMMAGFPPAISSTIAAGTGAGSRQNRRLPERILVAAHQACDLGDLDIAVQLLSILETVIGQQRGPVDLARRRIMEGLIAAHQRLWHLRHASETDGAPAGQGTIAAAKPLPGFHEDPDAVDFQPPA